MKKVLVLLFVVSLSLLTWGCASAPKENSTVINVWSITDEVPVLVQSYFNQNPKSKIKVIATIPPYEGSPYSEYQKSLDKALVNNEENAPDIYAVELSHTLKYTKGSMQNYAMPYSELGFDMETLIKQNKIAEYTVEIGSNTAGQVNGLCYQTTGGVFIYRRSIAKEVFGTDEPDEINRIIGGATGSWNSFLAAAETLGKHGYLIAPCIEDVWRAYTSKAENGWIVDGKLYIDPERKNFMEVAKKLIENNWVHNGSQWSDEWFQNMKGVSESPAFGYFGPSWFLNYTLQPNCGGTLPGNGTYGDWGICLSPSGFIWGGTWILVNKNLVESKKPIVKDLINYLTLDASKNGLLYKWANGDFSGGVKDSVASGVVMENLNLQMPLAGNQNISELLVSADSMVSAKSITDYDDMINGCWLKYVRKYSEGELSISEAIVSFKAEVYNIIDIK